MHDDTQKDKYNHDHKADNSTIYHKADNSSEEMNMIIALPKSQ
jgi:hypothetical protein